MRLAIQFIQSIVNKCFKDKYKTVSSAVNNIALVWEEKKERKKERNTEYLVTHPSNNPAEQGLTLLSGCDAVLSLRYYHFTLDIFFFSQKVSKVTV